MFLSYIFLFIQYFIFSFYKATYTEQRELSKIISFQRDRDVQVSAKNKRNEIKQDSCEERIYSMILFSSVHESIC